MIDTRVGLDRIEVPAGQSEASKPSEKVGTTFPTGTCTELNSESESVFNFPVLEIRGSVGPNTQQICSKPFKIIRKRSETIKNGQNTRYNPKMFSSTASLELKRASEVFSNTFFKILNLLVFYGFEGKFVPNSRFRAPIVQLIRVKE